MQRVEDYGTWYREFKAALEGMDVKRQQASPLPIIYQWAQPTPGKSGTKCVLAHDVAPDHRASLCGQGVQPMPQVLV